MFSNHHPNSPKILQKYQCASYYCSMKAMHALLTLGDITSEQWGMFTSAQARLRSISRVQIGRLHDIGAIERIRHGVYRVTSAPSEINEEIRAEWLSFRPEIIGYQRYSDPNDFVAIGTTALSLARVGDFYLEKIRFAHDGRFQTSQGLVEVRKRRIDWTKITLSDGIPALRTEWVIFDLLREGYDPGTLADLAREVHFTAAILADTWHPAELSFQHRRFIEELAHYEEMVAMRESMRRDATVSLYIKVPALAQ